jgi:predicted RNA-binding protein with PIN domain
VDVPDEALRPGLELAFVVAVLGTRQRPPIPAPPSLKRFLRFQKLPSAALAPVRKVVEEDDTFRTRVASVATETTVDRPSWLWLHRPDGWEADLEAAIGDAASGTGESAAGPLARRLEASEAKLRRVSAELAVLRDEVTRAQHGRAKAEGEADKARARQAELERAAERARQRSDQASAELRASQTETDALAAEGEELRARVTELERQLQDLLEAHTALDVGAAATAEDAPEASRSTPEAAVGGSAGASPGDTPAWPRKARDALAGAASAAASLAASLSELASSMDGGEPAPPPPLATSPAAPTRPPARPAETSAYAPRRRPLRVPRGMHLGTPEADSWLLTEAEAAVVVDGYNVAKLGWPQAALVDQREWLLDVLDDLTCRYGTTVEVVFDGADVGPVRPGRRRRVAVRFSPPTVSADDVIRELVAGLPPTDPIVVVTNDRAVAHDVRAAGANVVSSDGLLAVARR